MRAEGAVLRLSGAGDRFHREQRRMLDSAFDFVTYSKVDGDYLEFGVFQGKTFAAAWDAARRHGRDDMRFFAFDSFRGLPDPAISPVDAGGEFEAQEFSSDRLTFDKALRRGGVDPSRVQVVAGFYDQSLPAHPPASLGLEAAAIVWIDCDLYSSTVPVLDYVTDLLGDGSILVFDDWHCFYSRPDRGEQRACREWLDQHPDVRLVEYRDFHWAGRSFVVNRG